MKKIIKFLFLTSLIENIKSSCPTTIAPTESSECTEYNTDDIACCFVEYTSFNKCETISISKKYRFTLGFLTIFDDSNSFSCGVDPKTCGTNHPKELFQCREHSSISESCCMFDIDGETNCILADSKFGSESEHTESINVGSGSVSVTCYHRFLNIGIFGFLGFFIIFF